MVAGLASSLLIISSTPAPEAWVSYASAVGDVQLAPFLYYQLAYEMAIKLLNFVNWVVFGLLLSFFQWGAEQLLFFPTPTAVGPVLQLYIINAALYGLALFPIGGAYFLNIQAFPYQPEADPRRFIWRVVMGFLLVLVSPYMFTYSIRLVNWIGRYLTNGVFTVAYVAESTLPVAAKTGFGMIGPLLVALLGVGLITVGGLFYVVLALRALLVYAIFAIWPLLIAMWVVDIGAAKYAAFISKLCFKITVITLLMGVLIAGVLSVGAAVASSGQTAPELPDSPTEAGEEKYLEQGTYNDHFKKAKSIESGRHEETENGYPAGGVQNSIDPRQGSVKLSYVLDNYFIAVASWLVAIAMVVMNYGILFSAEKTNAMRRIEGGLKKANAARGSSPTLSEFNLVPGSQGRVIRTDQDEIVIDWAGDGTKVSVVDGDGGISDIGDISDIDVEGSWETIIQPESGTPERVSLSEELNEAAVSISGEFGGSDRPLRETAERLDRDPTGGVLSVGRALFQPDPYETYAELNRIYSLHHLSPQMKTQSQWEGLPDDTPLVSAERRQSIREELNVDETISPRADEVELEPVDWDDIDGVPGGTPLDQTTTEETIDDSRFNRMHLLSEDDWASRFGYRETDVNEQLSGAPSPVQSFLGSSDPVSIDPMATYPFNADTPSESSSDHPLDTLPGQARALHGPRIDPGSIGRSESVTSSLDPDRDDFSDEEGNVIKDGTSSSADGESQPDPTSDTDEVSAKPAWVSDQERVSMNPDAHGQQTDSGTDSSPQTSEQISEGDGAEIEGQSSTRTVDRDPIDRGEMDVTPMGWDFERSSTSDETASSQDHPQSEIDPDRVFKSFDPSEYEQSSVPGGRRPDLDSEGRNPGDPWETAPAKDALRDALNAHPGNGYADMDEERVIEVDDVTNRVDIDGEGSTPKLVRRVKANVYDIEELNMDAGGTEFNIDPESGDTRYFGREEWNSIRSGTQAVTRVDDDDARFYLDVDSK